ncbi:late competence development ComFB family protein [Alicyclobacillus sp. SO9]|uniref:late competence development ComFB family protein n=1 Tax=Alicyclobacillus sp. SO9 TaxID=2665646 RepID=UPI001936B53A|nr:late competence development ComFB family protein [Alicyclobacillus sp. SO9]QQE79373.1 late competence development ComFB family protein [Alicyclobacillus sp. SO9]
MVPITLEAPKVSLLEGGKMMVTNVVEQLVRNTLEENFLEDDKLFCSCELCQNDIVAFALNRLPPRYASSELGRAYIKSQYFTVQMQSDILREVTHAVEVVGQHPRHA